jgi:glycosyltransferase involved in cell wall biosynthesis
MNAPLISVVVTTYNRRDVLPRAIKSVLNQSFPAFEVIVVDDGSTGGIEEVVANFSDRRVSYEYQANAGPSAARNAGFRRSAGSYVTFLDDDDEVHPDWLECFAQVIEEHRPGMVCCGAVYLDDKGSVFKTLLPRKLGEVDGQRGLLRTGAYAIRRDVFEAVGGYAVEARRSTNTELGMRLVPLCAQNGWTIESVDKPMLRVHRHERSEGYYAGKINGATYILEAHEETLRRNPRKLAKYVAIAGVNASRLGDFAQARDHFRRATRIDPRIRYYVHLVAAYFPSVASWIWKIRHKRHTSFRG